MLPFRRIKLYITYRPTDTEVEFSVGAIDNGITSLFADVAVFHSQLDSSNVALQRFHVYSHRDITNRQTEVEMER